MKKLPYGISNYEELITENYYYVDKTQYIEKLENLPEKRIMFLRPRKFGKTLFTSTLEYYYDINSVDKFDKLFNETYIGKNPTLLKNSYYILRFNFSGIDTSTEEKTIYGFKSKVLLGIERFVNRYELDFFINKEQTAEGMLGSVFEAFRNQKPEQKIYVIIDEYDHFANELLGFRADNFKELVSENGKVRKWYEVLKEGTESVIGRIFITGVAPITLDSLTSGFNIGKNITRDEQFNEMLGFDNDEIVALLNDNKIPKDEQSVILPLMKENYDGYKFAINGKKKIFNSNMCLYFLSDYIRLGRMPESLLDVNIASDYSKLSGMLSLAKGEKKKEILEKTISGEGIVGNIVDKFNLAVEFQDEEYLSMLFYLGYLTIGGERFGMPELKIPNKVMSEINSSFFLGFMNEKVNENRYKIEDINELKQIAKEIRKDIVEQVYIARSGHPGGSLSIADIITVLYFNEMNIDEKNPKMEERDRFVLSKGHCAPALYAALSKRGFFEKDGLKSFRKIEGFLQGHPDMKKTPGIDSSSGSLGQGLSIANGMAISAKLDNKSYRVYCLLGDGEIEEGQVWEAAMASNKYKLDNLCVIVDNNNLQIDGTIEEVMSPYPIDEKFRSFGFNVINIDGNNIEEILKAFDQARWVKGKPTCIVAKTVKGKGVSFMENKIEWHGKAPSEEEYKLAIEELEEKK